MIEKLKAYIRGAFKSKTMWLGGIVSALGALSDNAQYLRNIIKDDIGFNTFMIEGKTCQESICTFFSSFIFKPELRL